VNKENITNLGLALVLSTFLLLACSSSPDNSQNVNNLSVEQQLVSIDKKVSPGTDDIDVKRVRFLLDYLAENTTTSRKDIAEITNKSVQVIENKYGKKVTNQEFLEGARRLVSTVRPSMGARKDDYKAVAFLLVMEMSTK
jgi:uncharacterized protein YcfL